MTLHVMAGQHRDFWECPELSRQDITLRWDLVATSLYSQAVGLRDRWLTMRAEWPGSLSQERLPFYFTFSLAHLSLLNPPLLGSSFHFRAAVSWRARIRGLPGWKEADRFEKKTQDHTVTGSKFNSVTWSFCVRTRPGWLNHEITNIFS